MNTPTEKTKNAFAALFVKQFYQSHDLSEPMFRDGILTPLRDGVFIRRVAANAPGEVFDALVKSFKKEQAVQLLRGITLRVPKDREALEKEVAADREIAALVKPAIEWIKNNLTPAMDLLRVVAPAANKETKTVATKEILDHFEKQGIVGSRPLPRLPNQLNRLKGLQNFFPTRSTKLQAEEKPQAKTPFVKYA